MLINFLFSAGVLEYNVVLAQDQSENFGYLYIETDPPDAVIRIDRELRRAQKRRPEEIETKQKADTVKPIGNPVPLIRAADVGHDRILVRSSRSFAVGDTVRIEQNQDGNLPKRVSDHEIVRIGVVDAIPALFIRPPLINTFETTTGEVGESGNARIFKINPPKSPRIFAVPVVAPAYLAEDVEPVASQIKVYVSSIASRFLAGVLVEYPILCSHILLKSLFNTNSPALKLSISCDFGKKIKNHRGRKLGVAGVLWMQNKKPWFGKGRPEC